MGLIRIIHDRRALSPIFAALLMVGIVTALFIPVFLWSTGLTAGIRSFWEETGTSVTERIEIEEVNLRQGSTNCTVYVRNIGKTLARVTEVVIKGDDGQSLVFEKSQFATTDPVTKTGKDSIAQGDLLKVYIPSLAPLTLQKDVSYIIKVVTSRGVGDTYQVRA